MIEYDGEQYLTANEVAKRFNLSWGTCSTNLLPQMQECHLPGRKRVFYRLSDVEQFSEVRLVAKVSCSVLPIPASQAAIGSMTTSNPNSSKWAGKASIAYPSTHHHMTRKDA